MSEDERYRNREIDQRFSDLRQQITDLSIQMTDGFNNMYARQDETNGRVTTLEKWRNYIMGGIAVLTIIVTTLLAMLVSVAEAALSSVL